MRRSAVLLLLCLLGPAWAGCLAEGDLEVSRHARGVRSVTWSVRENGTWSLDGTRALAADLGFETEVVDSVLLAFHADRELLRFTPRATDIVVSMTLIDPHVVPPGLEVRAVAEDLAETYTDTADATLAAFEEAFGWTRQGEGAWSHATYRPSASDPLRAERRTLVPTLGSPVANG